MRITFCGLAAWCLITAVPYAQDAGRVEPPPQAPAHNTMVLTGCLAAGADAVTFKLNNAVPNAQASAVQPQAVATSGASPAVYELKAEARLDAQSVAPVDLKAFVGRQVEITARPDDVPAAAAPAKPSEQATSDPDPAKKADEKIEHLRVAAVKQLAETCK
jgi:hypothetical protein